MNRPKNQNSILVLATLGVYLGLVLAGATPQVMANAAMTRQFNVKDEIEVKDDLDTKPEPSLSNEVAVTSTETHRHVSKSVRKFLAKFQTAGSLHTVAVTSESVRFPTIPIIRFQTTTKLTALAAVVPINRIISISNFPRGSLSLLLLFNAQ